ncbi:MAG: hypothetical protein KC708_01995 [Anaerolineae bacterium]|nr:hypothetical protein [Anaerolineae bacterium]
MNNRRIALMITLLILPLILAALASYSIWGYFIAPPAPLTDDISTVTNMSVVSMREELTDKVRIALVDDVTRTYYWAGVDSDAVATMHHMYQASSNDYALFRGVDALYEKMPASLADVDAATKAQFSDFITQQQDDYAIQTGDSFLGCNGTDFRGHAILIEGSSADGTPLLYVTISSNQLTNDDYRLLEYVFAQTDNGLELQNSQQFIYHVAGMEGFDFRILAPIFLLLMLPFMAIAWRLSGPAQAKRKREDSTLIVG